MEKGRDENGRFASGNPGGPGRPPRPIETQYLATIGDRVSLKAWGEVVDRALADAKAGNAAAREWLTRHLIGPEPPSLLDVAANEMREISLENEVAKQAVLDDIANHVASKHLNLFVMLAQHTNYLEAQVMAGRTVTTENDPEVNADQGGNI